MKQLLDETSASQILDRSDEPAETPPRQDESQSTRREIFVFDGWGLVPLELPTS